MASSTACGFCADDAESRYTSRLPLTWRFRTGKSAWMRATSSGVDALMLARSRPCGPGASRRPQPRWQPSRATAPCPARCSPGYPAPNARSCRDLRTEGVEALGLEPLGQLRTAAHRDATVEQHV